MIDLQCAIISLRFANQTISAEYLDGNYILFHKFGIPHIYSLGSGVICADNWELSGCGMMKVLCNYYERSYSNPMQVVEKMTDHEKALI